MHIDFKQENFSSINIYNKINSLFLIKEIAK